MRAAFFIPSPPFHFSCNLPVPPPYFVSLDLRWELLTYPPSSGWPIFFFLAFLFLSFISHLAGFSPSTFYRWTPVIHFVDRRSSISNHTYEIAQFLIVFPLLLIYESHAGKGGRWMWAICFSIWIHEYIWIRSCEDGQMERRSKGIFLHSLYIACFLHLDLIFLWIFF